MGLMIDIHRSFRRGPTISARMSLRDEITVLFGPSGCGKTTVLRCIAGVETPDSGTIRTDHVTWFDAATGVNLPPQRRGIGYVVQEQSLFPHLTVHSNVAYGLSRWGGPINGSARSRVDEMLDLFGLADLRHRYPRQLSGGQRQRIALARALAPMPRLVLLDEPLASLDEPARQALRAELRDALTCTATPALLVTHDRNEALALGDAIAVMADGTVRQCGPVHRVLAQPADPDVAAAVGVETVVEGRITTTDDSLSHVQVGDVILTALNQHQIEGRVLVCVRAEDVQLRCGEPDGESARNRLKGRIVAVESAGPMMRITLDCGFTLAALVTRNARDELGLHPGVAVTALIKAPHIHLIPRGGGVRGQEPGVRSPESAVR